MPSGIKFWCALSLFSLHALPNFAQDSNASEGWIILFDGKTLDDWHSYLRDEALPQWKVEEGTLTLTERGGRDLVTDMEFENFELELEWKIEEGGNSGIIYRVHEDSMYNATYRTGLEMQVLDNWRHPDAKMGKNGNRTAGALYDMIAPADTMAVNVAGEWNQVRLVVNNGTAEHYMNGKKIVSYSFVGPEWEKMVAESKFKDWEGFGAYAVGRIALQDHGNRVWYRNIRIRKLGP